jgi:hypothetical protein
MTNSIFGYYSSPEQLQPDCDPGLEVPCPFCLKKLERPVRTISLLAVGDTRSFFYRAHRQCAVDATPEMVTDVESSLIDARVTGPDTLKGH